MNKVSEQGDDEFCREIEHLARLHHRHLVALKGFCVEKKERFLIYEYMENGSLNHLHRMPGSARLRDCEILKKITTKQADEKRLYGAICAAPAVTLHSWGLLRRKQTTCHPAFMAKLPHFQAVNSIIQVSGELTSRGPAYQFALSLVEQLWGSLLPRREVGQSLVRFVVVGIISFCYPLLLLLILYI